LARILCPASPISSHQSYLHSPAHSYPQHGPETPTAQTAYHPQAHWQPTKMDRSQNFVRDFPLQEKVDILNYATRGLFNSFQRSVEDVAERNNVCPDQVL